MKRTTATLLTGAMSLGTVAVLSTVAPGVASASCTTDPQVLDQDTFFTTFDSAENDNRADDGTDVPVEDKITVTPDGLHMVNTANLGKASAYYDVEPRLLETQTDPVNYAIVQDSTGAQASYQLVVDLDGDGDRDGILVLERQHYGERWWLSSLDNASDTTDYSKTPNENGGSAEHSGVLNSWVAAYPDAEILGFGFSLGSWGVGDLTLSSITFGCNDFSFVYRNDAPTAAIYTDNGGDANYRTVWFNGSGSSDLNGDDLTYAWDVDGDGTTDSTQREFLWTYPGGTKNYDVTLTVDDGTVDSNPATTTVTVTQPTNTVNTDNPLAETGADVKGLAALGGLVVAGSAAGLVANKRRKGNSAA